MSDKVLIERELLERIVNAPSLTDEGEAIDKLRALLSEQPQASAAQSAPVAPEGERLADLLESVWMGDDEAKPHGIGATYWNNAVIACKVAIRDAIAAAPAQPAAQGYVIVPVDPTPKMLVAYMETDGAVKRWKAMVAASKTEGAHA